MAGDLIVGIDAGTSVIKAVAFTLDGRQLAMTAEANAYTTLPDGGVEQDMARTWRETAAVLRRLGDEVEGLERRCAALAVTGQGDGTWLIDADGEPVAPAWLWLDSRAAALVEERRADGTGARTYRLTGSGLNACQQGVHLVWLAEHRPELLERATTACHCKDWLYFKLTGERATDPTEGSFTFGDFRRRAYAPEILDALGIPELARLLPPMVDGTALWHPLDHEAARGGGPRCRNPGGAGQRRRRLHRDRRRSLQRGARARLLGDRLDRHAHADRAWRRRRDPERGLHRLHHGAAGRGHLGPDAVEHGGDAQHRLAARPRGRGGERARRQDQPQGRARRGRCPDHGGAARGGAVPSLHPYRRRARPVRRAPGPGAVHRPRPRPGFFRARPRRLRGPRVRGPRLLRGDGPSARGGAGHRGCGAQPGAAPDLSQARSGRRSGPARARKRAPPVLP